MVDRNGVLMIEPRSPASAVPVIDAATRKMAAALRGARVSSVTYRSETSDQHTPDAPVDRGFHMCVCGARGGSNDLYVRVNTVERLTHSLAVHYLAYHRADVSPEEMAKVMALDYGEVEPDEHELVPPGHSSVRPVVNATR